jgi:hypothetical protein
VVFIHLMVNLNLQPEITSSPSLAIFDKKKRRWDLVKLG